MRDEIAAVRRARRVKRVSEEIATVLTMAAVNRQIGPFDPNLGASGRPEPLLELPAGQPTSRHESLRLNRLHHWGQKVRWNGTALAFEEARLHGLTYNIAVRPVETAQVSEVALFASKWGWTPVQYRGDEQTPARIYQGSLHFLDRQGYAILYFPEVECYWREIIDIVKATGLTFRAYVLSCPKKNAEEIADLLFPHHMRSIKFCL